MEAPTDTLANLRNHPVGQFFDGLEDQIAEAQRQRESSNFIERMFADDPSDIHRKAMDDAMQYIHRLRYVEVGMHRTETEEELQRRWKQPEMYHEGGHHKPWLKFVPFHVYEGGTPDFEWLNGIAGDADVPLYDRIARIVTYLNNFWAFIGTGRNTGVVSKSFSTMCNRGATGIAETREKEFESHYCNRSLWFRTSKFYTDEEQREIVRLFNGGHSRGAVAASSLPKGRKGQPTLEGEEPTPSGPHTYAVPVYKVWKYNTLRRTVTSVIFDPTPEHLWDDGTRSTARLVLNTWQPFAFPAERVAGKADLYSDKLCTILAHIKEVLCCNHDHLFTQLIYTWAFWLQQPWRQFESVPIIKGEQGCGKSLVLDAICAIVGNNMSYKTSDIDDATGEKTDRLEGIYILYLNEAYNPASRKHDSQFKSIITEKTYRLRKFYNPPVQVPKYFRTMMDTNHSDVINAEGKDRRWALYECHPTIRPEAYYTNLLRTIYNDEEEVKNAGLQAFADFLYRFDIERLDDTFNAGRRPVVTRLLVQQQMASMDARKRVFLEILQQGRIHETSRCFDREDEWLRQQRNITGYRLAEAKRNQCRDEMMKLSNEGRRYKAGSQVATDEFSALEKELDYWQRECKVSLNWETVIPMDKLVRLYRRLAAEQGNNRKAMESGLVDQAKNIFGPENVFYYQRQVALIATDKDKTSGVKLRQRASGDTKPFDLLEDTVQRTYLQLPLLQKARDLYSNYMGWEDAECDPFNKDDSNDAYQRAKEDYDSIYETTQRRPGFAQGTCAFKRRYTPAEPLNTQQEEQMYDAGLGYPNAFDEDELGDLSQHELEERMTKRPRGGDSPMEQSQQDVDEATQLPEDDAFEFLAVSP
jgi:hypothetical protein